LVTFVMADGHMGSEFQTTLYLDARYRPGVRHKRMFVQTVKLCPPKIANFFQKKIISPRLFFNFLNFVRKITSLELFKILWKKFYWWLYNVLESIIREIWLSLSLSLPRTGLARIWLVNRIHEMHLIG
jgi:hypothetical protein